VHDGPATLAGFRAAGAMLAPVLRPARCSSNSTLTDPLLRIRRTASASAGAVESTVGFGQRSRSGSGAVSVQIISLRAVANVRFARFDLASVNVRQRSVTNGEHR
jgi:hypothetical protein